MELRGMAHRIIRMRQELYNALQARGGLGPGRGAVGKVQMSVLASYVDKVLATVTVKCLSFVTYAFLPRLPLSTHTDCRDPGRLVSHPEADWHVYIHGTLQGPSKAALNSTGARGSLRMCEIGCCFALTCLILENSSRAQLCVPLCCASQVTMMTNEWHVYMTFDG